MWKTSWIFIDGGSQSLYATGLIFFVIGKGPYHFGESFLFPVIERFRPSSHTWSPSFISVLFRSSLLCWTWVSSFWADCLDSSRSWSLVSAAGVGDSRCFRITWGFDPIRSSCGDFLVTSCRQELWANSAIGRICHDSPPCLMCNTCSASPVSFLLLVSLISDSFAACRPRSLISDSCTPRCGL